MSTHARPGTRPSAPGLADPCRPSKRAADGEALHPESRGFDLISRTRAGSKPTGGRWASCRRISGDGSQTRSSRCVHHGAHCTLGGLVGGAGADSVARTDTEITSAFRIAHSRHRRRREMLAQTTPASGQTSKIASGAAATTAPPSPGRAGCRLVRSRRFRKARRHRPTLASKVTLARQMTRSTGWHGDPLARLRAPGVL
jgi:hypothetical protein